MVTETHEASGRFVPSRTASKSCMLCPRGCSANRAAGVQGLCGAADELVVARAALHFWEEPPISGESGSGAVFFSHCPLRCLYCQNEPVASGAAGKAISVDRLAEIYLELAEAGARNINLVTPTHYLPQIMYTLDLARARGLCIPIVYNTSGYESVEAIRSLAGYIDVYLTDFKYWTSKPAQAYSRAPDYPEIARRALDEMVAQTGPPLYGTAAGEQSILLSGTIVRHMMLPSLFEESCEIVRYVFERYGENIALSLMNQYTPMGTYPAFRELEARVCQADYELLLDFADRLGIEDYFWQEGNAVGESFIPSFDNTGV